MKTLQAFWRWVDNEKPETLTVVQKACGSKALSSLARTALDQAADVVWAMHKDSPVGFSLKGALDGHRDDLRDVSLVLLPALEKVVERRCVQDEKSIGKWSGLTPVEKLHALRAKRATLTCVGCGLRYGKEFPEEPTVGTRSDGLVRCADCQQKHRAGIVQTAIAPPQPLKCGRCDGSGVSPHRNIVGTSVTCGRCLGTGVGTAPAVTPLSRSSKHVECPRCRYVQGRTPTCSNCTALFIYTEPAVES
jgi:hypothetical protein